MGVKVPQLKNKLKNKNMYHKRQYIKTGSIVANDSTDGETIERKMARITQNKEPITDGAEIIYTDRKDGVMAGYNIRTDRFEVAVEAMDKVTKDKLSKREGFIKSLEEKNKPSAENADKKVGDTGGVTAQGENTPS